MLKNIVLLFVGCMAGAAGCFAQLIREYRVEEQNGYELVHLDFNTSKSQVNLKQRQGQNPVAIHGHLEEVNILPVFDHWLENSILYAKLSDKHLQSENLGRSITSRLFSKSKDDFGTTWDILMSPDHLYSLNFNLGVGESHFDLESLPVKHLEVHSASSDVFVVFGSAGQNRAEMDTLLVTVNMGTVEVKQANFSNAKKIILEVNYGKINLDFENGMTSSCQIVAAVGAGSLNLKLPSENFPIKLKMKTTPMCRATLPNFFRELDEETYVTKGYAPNHPNLMELTVDVGVGTLKVE